MSRSAILAALAAVALAGCSEPQKPVPAKAGPAVAKGNGIVITADELKARLDEQSPFVRQRFTTTERKREFLDNLVRFEVLAREAERQGLRNDPDVQLMMKRVMVQKLVQKSFATDEAEAARKIGDADIQKYYDEHAAEYHRPAKVRVSHLLVKAPASGPEREKAEAEARKLVERARAAEQKAPGAFAALAREASHDDATKAVGGDLGFRTKEDLALQISPEAADAALALKDGEIAGPIPSAQGFHVVRRTGWQDPVDRSLADVKAQIASQLAKERRGRDFDTFVKDLVQKANVKVDDKELEKVTVSAGGPGMGGAAPGPMGGSAPHGPMGGAPVPGGAAAPRP